MRCGRWCSDSITDPWSSAALSLINWIFKSKHSLHQHEPSILALDFPRIFHFPSILNQKKMFSEPHTLNTAWVSLDWKGRKLPALELCPSARRGSLASDGARDHQRWGMNSQPSSFLVEKSPGTRTDLKFTPEPLRFYPHTAAPASSSCNSGFILHNLLFPVVGNPARGRGKEQNKSKIKTNPKCLALGRSN